MSITQTVIERTTNVVAAGAIATPVWLPSLESVSETAALWVPIAGLCWIVIQIVIKLKNHNK